MIIEEWVYWLPDNHYTVWLDNPLTVLDAEMQYSCLQTTIRLGVIRILQREHPGMDYDTVSDLSDNEMVVLWMDISELWKEPIWHCRTGELLHVNGPARASAELWKQFYLNPNQKPISKKRSDITI